MRTSLPSSNSAGTSRGKAYQAFYMIAEGSAFCTAERCREISQGYACFTRTPGSGEPLKPAPREACEESSHAFSVRRWVNIVSQGCAPLNPWLMSCHPFRGEFRD